MTLIALNADVLVTMDAQRAAIKGAVRWWRTDRPCRVATAELPAQYRRMADEGQARADMRGKVVTPGLVNTHHHMYQSLRRAPCRLPMCELFSRLVRKPLHAVVASDARDAHPCLDPDRHGRAHVVGLHHDRSDHPYLFPIICASMIPSQPRSRWACAFTRGSASSSRSKGGLPPDVVVEEEEAGFARQPGA